MSEELMCPTCQTPHPVIAYMNGTPVVQCPFVPDNEILMIPRRGVANADA